MIFLIYLSIILGGIIFDQVTKYTVAYFLPVDNSGDIAVWDGVLSLRCISNDGAAFGMLDDKRWVFMTVSTVVILGMFVFLCVKHKTLPKLLGVALSIIVSGGIGNMIDRVCLGYVIDFIYFVPIDFPCFNVADSLVCIGCVLMFIGVLIYGDDDEKKKKAAASKENASDSEDAVAAEDAEKISDGTQNKTQEADGGEMKDAQ